MISNIHWLGHDSFRIEGEGLVIYIDPWQLQNPRKADLILITHDHGDHCSPEDVAKIRKEDTEIVTVESAAKQLSGNIRIVRPGDETVVKGLSLRAVPSYNVNKYRSPGVHFHPRKSGYVGFIITVEGKRIYHTGDSDFIPEMKSLEADIVLIPVSGTYVMTADEAVDAVSTLSPQMAIPMHVGRGIGALDDAVHFKDKASVPVTILEIEE
jgi:L-ascorbate metabolism protein UlaG (beta-lactamase superfamily)